jgi:hypothetical protein
MNLSRRLFALIALATALAACSPGVGSIESEPAASQTAEPSVTQASPVPTSSPLETAPPATLAPTESPIASPDETPEPTVEATDPALVFAANGIGPYAIGASMAELQSSGLITNVEPSLHCDDSWRVAEATGRYAGQLHLTFHLGRLTDIGTDSRELVTPSGAQVGMTLADLRDIYGSRGTLITGVNGNQAFSVRVLDTTLGIIFFLDETNTTTQAMTAGEIDRLEEAVTVGEGC